jgi:DNA-directed RNA polymerase specialized sigma subunit
MKVNEKEASTMEEMKRFFSEYKDVFKEYLSIEEYNICKKRWEENKNSEEIGKELSMKTQEVFMLLSSCHNQIRNNLINPRTSKPYAKGFWDMIRRKYEGKMFFLTNRDFFILLLKERELRICKMYWEDDVFQPEIGRTIGLSTKRVRQLLTQSRDTVEKYLKNS